MIVERKIKNGCGINALAAMTNRRDCCIFGTGLGCVAIWDTRTRGVEQLGLYSRGMEGELMDLHVAHKGGVGALWETTTLSVEVKAATCVCLM